MTYLALFMVASAALWLFLFCFWNEDDGFNRTIRFVVGAMAMGSAGFAYALITGAMQC